MNDEKNTVQKEKFNFITIYVIGFVIAMFFEFYWISYYPYDYFMLFGIGIILCILGYLSIDELLHIISRNQKKREEQNEIMIKASKAIYLATKKNTMDADKKQMQNLKALDMIINNALGNEAKAGQSDSSSKSDITTLIDDLAKANDRLAKEMKNVMSVTPILKENEEIINVAKDMHLDEPTVATDFETIVTPDEITKMMDQDMTPENSIEEESEENILEEPVSTMEPADVEIPVEEDVAATVDVSVEEDVFPTDEVPVEEDVSVTDDVPVEEDVSVTDDVPVEEDVSVTDDVPVEEDVIPSEPETIDNADISVEPEITPETNEFQDLMNDLSETVSDVTKNDDAKPLTPDEIAALFANL